MNYGYVSTPNPFDIAAINRAIDEKLETLPAGDRGRATIQLKDGSVIGALIIRGPAMGKFRSFALGEVTKPKAGAWGWTAQAGVSFLYGAGPIPDPPAVTLAPELRGLYRLFRARGYDFVTAAIKASLVNFGSAVRL